MKAIVLALVLLLPPASPLPIAEPAEIARARDVVADLDALRDALTAEGAYAYTRALVDLSAEPARAPRVDAKAYLGALAPGADLRALDALAPDAYAALGDLLAPHAMASQLLRGSHTLAELEALRAQTIRAADRVHALRDALKVETPPVDVCGALYLYTGSQPQTISCDHLVTIAGHGDDLYLADAGGASLAEASLALDLGGDDTRILTTNAFTGIYGGALSGFGALIDLEGNDVNEGHVKVNGRYAQGAAFGGGSQAIPYPPGVGLLLDFAGDDSYRGFVHEGGVNGGSSRGASGALLDLGGTDVFEGATIGLTSGINGGSNDGVAILFDCGGGANLYTGRSGERAGINGGGEQSVSAFVSCGGDGTRYEGVAQGGGVNGGASGEAVTAFVHLEGDATFDATARYGGVNGGGYRASSFLVSGRGSQHYIGALGDIGGINGGAVMGSGALVDLEGNDEYVARAPGTIGANGGGIAGGAGMLVDAAGDDVYDADVGGAQARDLELIVAGEPVVALAGGSVNGRAGTGGCALLLDLDGSDRYRDAASAPWTHDESAMEPGTCGGRLDIPYV